MEIITLKNKRTIVSWTSTIIIYNLHCCICTVYLHLSSPDIKKCNGKKLISQNNEFRNKNSMTKNYFIFPILEVKLYFAIYLYTIITELPCKTF